jgi:hypothetical protein
VEERYWVPSKAILPQGEEADAAAEYESVNPKSDPMRRVINFKRLWKFIG